MSAFAAMPAKTETPRLVLRPRRVADAETVRALWAERDPRTERRIDEHGHPTVAELRANIAAQEREAESTGLRLWALERRGEPGFIGYCGLIVGVATEDEPEIAFELFRAEQGRGYATEAGRAVVAAARDTGRLRLWASVRVWNAASFRVLAKLDFEGSGRVTADPLRGDIIWMTLPLDGSRDAGNRP